MNFDKKLLSIAVSDSLYQALTAYQEKHQLDSAASATIKILTQFFQLDEEAKHYATLEQLEALSEEVAHLSDQVEALSQIRASYVPTTAEPAVAIGVTSPTSAANPSSPSVSTVVPFNLDEEEDEADEILYEFLENKLG